MTAAVSRRAALGAAGALLGGLAVGSGEEAAGIRPGDRDALKLRLLHKFGQLTPEGQDALVRAACRMREGMPARHAGYLAHRELGATLREARDRIDEVLASVAAAKEGRA